MTYIEEIIKNIPNGLYYLAGAWTLWQVARLYFARFCKTEDSVKELSQSSNRVDTRLSGVEQKLSRIETILDRICRYLAVKDALRPDYFSSHSPITLTDLAKELFVDSGAKEYAQNHADTLLDQLEAQAPTNKLDVQQKATYVVIDASNKPEFNKVKDFIYENPIYKGSAVNLGILVDIIALDLRDRYLAKHPEL